MTDARQTPGPWFYRPEQDDVIRYIDHERGIYERMEWADVVNPPNPPAVVDLIQALCNAVSLFRGRCRDDVERQWLLDAEDALRKATGSPV